MTVVWTAEMIEELKNIVVGEGKSYGTAAQLMTKKFSGSFTKNSCIGKGRSLGFPLRLAPRKKDEPVTIYDLRDGLCKWPFGKITDRPPYIYCGEPTGDIGCSWCPTHREQVYSKSTFSSKAG